MSVNLDLQIASTSHCIPKYEEFERWVNAALNGKEAEICIRIVDEAEMVKLNVEYRHKQGVTNVLAFPAQLFQELESKFLGDIVICAPVINKGAISWPHITVHGVLHLLGFTHEDEQEAHRMEEIEHAILKKLGCDN